MCLLQKWPYSNFDAPKTGNNKYVIMVLMANHKDASNEMNERMNKIF